MSAINSMMNINNFAATVSENYAAAINDLRGEFSQILGLRNPAAAAIRRRFTDIAIRLFDKRLHKYKSDLEGATVSVMRDALLSASIDPDAFLKTHGKPLLDYIQELVFLTTLGVSNLAKKDVKYGADKLKALSFDVLTTMTRSGIKNAVSGAVVKSMLAGSNYSKKDGRPWRSIVSSELATRYHLITVFNETTIFAGSELGDEEFIIKSAISSNRFNNQVITANEYQLIREKAFHPNSNSLIFRK